MRCTKVLMFTAMAVGLSACGNTSGAPDCEFDSTFAAVEAVFEARGCTAGACHGAAEDQAAGKLDLRAGFAFDSLDKGEPQASTTPRLFPGDEELSLLYIKLAAKTNGESLPNGIGGAPMPASGDALSENELELIRLWLRSGAPEAAFVADTEKLLACNPLVEASPNKIPPPEVPDPSVGVQLYAGAWPLPTESEDEICFVTYYDVSETLPPSRVIPCDDEHGGPERNCFAYGNMLLSQDPQSHHSITEKYIPPVDFPEQLDPNGEDSGWNNWICLGGDKHGQTCDPTNQGWCGERSNCATEPESTVACVGYINAPEQAGSLFGFFGAEQSRINIATAQEFIFREEFPDQVYSLMPVKGFLMWNSHAFNLTTQDTTIEQWITMEFADDPVYSRRQIFDASEIFGMGRVAPFEKTEVCNSFVIPRYSHLLTLSTHMHKRGALFRVWYPPNEACEPGPDCQPLQREADYSNRLYNDPLYQRFGGTEPNFFFDSDNKDDRTFRFCAVYDNGFTDPDTVRRNSIRAPAAVCEFLSVDNPDFDSDRPDGIPANVIPDRCGCEDEVMACYRGPDEGQLCGGDDSACGGAGICDACPVAGGVTTEDEMFLLLGSFYIEPPES